MMLLLVCVAIVVLPCAVGAGIPTGVAGWPVRWAAGALAMGAVTLMAIASGVSAAPATIGTAAIAVGAGSYWWRRSVLEPRQSVSRSEAGLLMWLLLLFSGCVVLALAQPGVMFDTVAIWYAKVRALLAGDPISLWPAPPYPALGPTMWAMPLLVLGVEHEAIGRILFALFYFAFSASLISLCPRPLSMRMAILLAVVSLASLEPRYIVSGYQDVLVASVAGMASVLIARDLIEPRSNSGVWGAAIAGTLGLIKVEGLVLGAILVGLWIAVRAWPPRNLRVAGTSAALAIGAIAFAVGGLSWPLVLSAHGVEPQLGWTPREVTPDLITSNLGRLPAILNQFAIRRIDLILATSAALLSLAAWPSSVAVRRALAWGWAVVAVHSAAVVGLFLVTEANLSWHLPTTFPRIVGQHTTIWMVIIVVASVAVSAGATSGAATAESGGSSDSGARRHG